jgi:DNA ligase-associated metallophosphoesterase
MNAHIFQFSDLRLHALPSGALFVPDHATLCVSDLHLGKSDRIARRTGTMIPPYENRATLEKLAEDINKTSPKTVICLGDSFDDLHAADALDDAEQLMLTQMQAGRQWIWIEGNHDPGPVDLGGTHLGSFKIGHVWFRHIASNATPEISGHYHPKHGIQNGGRMRACFAYDDQRLILPAYGAYTGGLSLQHPGLRGLFGKQVIAVLTGNKAIGIPVT